MKKTYRILFLFPLLGLTSCNPNNNIITTICPLGAPSICYYTEGDNQNFVTNSPTAIVPQFQKNNPDYDALIIDSTTGLAQAKKNKSKYKFAKLLTAGNLYLIGLNDNKLPPTSNDQVIYAFGENNLTGLVFKHILNSKFGITNINFVEDVSKISPIVITGKYGGENVDYVLIAEPLLYSCAHVSDTHFIEGINYKATINSLWKSIPTHESILIPQAALFVNVDSYNKKKELFSTYIKNLDKRINTAISNPDEVKKTLNNFAHGDETKVTNKFGFKSEIAYNVQKDNNNGFALYSSNEEYTCDKMNTFLKDLGVTTRYEESDFISIK